MENETKKTENVTELAENVTEKVKINAFTITAAASVHVNEIMKKVEGLIIEDQNHYNQSCSLLKNILKPAFNQLEKDRKEIVKPLNVAKANAQAVFNPVLDQYKKARKILDGAILSYEDEQERIRRAEQEKLRLKTEAEERKQKKILQERADKAAAKGNTEKEESLRDQAATFHKPVSVLEKPAKMKGVSSVSTWKARPANGDIQYNLSTLPLNYHLANDAMLQKMAVATKGQIPVPGVEFYEKKSISVRG